MDSNKNERILCVSPVTPKSRVFIDFIYDKALKSAISDGLMTEAEILFDAGKKGFWTKDDDNQIALLTEELKKIPNVISGSTKREDRKLAKLRDSIKLQISELEITKNSIIKFSAERYAEEAKIRAFVYSCVTDEDGNRIWANWQDFNNETDVKFIDNILLEISSNKQTEYDTKQIREIARSGIWRHKWGAAKAIDMLFEKSVLELSDEQSSLVYWSQLYDSVYDAYERPPQEVIEDDDKLDEWLEGQAKKVNLDAQNNYKDKYKNKKNGISSNVSRHGEIFVVTDGGLGPVNDKRLVLNTDLPSRQEIYDMNTELGKKFLSHQDRKIKQAGGYIQEEDLRSDKDSRRVIGANDAVVSIRRGKDGLPRKQVDKLLPGGTISGRRV